MRQVVLNLLSNAVKFTEQGSVKIAAQVENGHWLIEITDTGVGIAPEHLAMIFEEFRQVDASSTRQAGGTGLGLAISRKMANMMGGDIYVHSVIGQGSTFVLRLPRVPAIGPAAAATLDPTPAGRPKGGLVLLAIDDDPDVLELVTTRLANTEFSVVTALGGEAGLNLAQTLRPDVITLDILMPGLDGWEVLRRLKANPALAHVPVVMMSIIENRALAFGMGAAECLVKPVSRDRLLEVLRRNARTDDAPVLVVDDEADARALVGGILSTAGYAWIEAANGKEALAAIAERRPSLVVLDLMMPELDGFQVIERLAADPETRAIPIVVLTAMALSPDDVARLSQGAQLVLDKAATLPETLIEDLRGFLRKQVGKPRA